METLLNSTLTLLHGNITKPNTHAPSWRHCWTKHSRSFMETLLNQTLTLFHGDITEPNTHTSSWRHYWTQHLRSFMETLLNPALALLHEDITESSTNCPSLGHITSLWSLVLELVYAAGRKLSYCINVKTLEIPAERNGAAKDKRKLPKEEERRSTTWR